MTARQTRQEWKAAYPVFILKIDWNGKPYYASTKPIVLSSSRGLVQLQGGLLEEPQFESSLSELGFQVSSYSTPIACYLIDVDIALQASRNNTLENASAELSYILIKGDQAQSYDNRVVLMRGLIKEPIYGHRDRMKGYFEASIEAPILETSLHSTSMGQGARISASELSDFVNPTLSPLSAIQNSDYLLNLLDVHKEKTLPIVFGTPGETFDDEMNTIRFGATPAYVLYAESGSTNKMWLAIAPHDVEATRVRIYDDLGNNRLESVEKWIRNDGRIFSFVHFTHSSGGFQNPVDDENARFFVAFQSIYGGGLISPTTNQAINGAGDICMWCLEQGQQEIDYVSWEALNPFLNSYKIAGYINDEEISPIEFLEKEIIPLLPISVIQGINGMKPILDLFASGIKPMSIASIFAGPEFSSSSAIQQKGDTSSLINDVTIKFCFDMKQQAHQAKQRLTGDETLFDNKVSINDIAIKSFNKYGSRPTVIETSFVHDIDTASLICFDIIRNNAFPSYILEYICAPRFGWIEVGDILALTDSDFNLESELVQVIQKSWQGQNWSITIKLSPEYIK
jgi:hypothetical protein